MDGLSLVVKGKEFSKSISQRPLTLEQRIFDIFADKRINRGAIWDPSDTSTLFQDADGLIPVTADNDPVRLMLDKSGNGAHWVAPSDIARPLYKAGPVPYLQGDGVNSEVRMVPEALGLTSFANQVSLTAGLVADSMSTYRTAIQIMTSSNTQRLSVGTGADAGAFRSFVRRKWDDAATELNLPKPTGLHLWNLFADYIGGSATLSRDVSAASDTDTLPLQKISENPASIGAFMFAFNGTGFANMRFYGGILLASEQDITQYQADIDAYLTGKFGI